MVAGGTHVEGEKRAEGVIFMVLVRAGEVKYREVEVFCEEAFSDTYLL